MLGWWDPMYFVFVGPAILLALYASFKVKSTFAKAREMTTRRGWTGRDIAQAILDSEGIHDVTIEPINSYLGDHYDPRERVLRLSPDVYNGRSIAAAGVAAHEVGHAIQHAQGYAALSLRNSIVPLASIGSNLSLILIMVGLAMTLQSLMIVGCALFTMVVLFQVINLPVEFNASTRARQALLANGLVTEVEDKEVGRVLRAAAMTYVAATLTAVLTLLYYLMRAGLLGGHRDD